MILILALLTLIVGCSEVTTEIDDTVEDVEDVIIPEADDEVVVVEEEPEPEEEQTSTVKEIQMTAKNWEFIPDTITVNQGDTVKLEIESVDVKHGIILSAFGVNEDLNPGETVNIEFIADKKGEFPFFCSVFCGSGHGSMDGKLIVE